MDHQNYGNPCRSLHGLCRIRCYLLEIKKRIFMSPKTFVTAINCMDGRVQEPIINWMKQQYNADYIDMITEPGPIKDLSDTTPSRINESIQNRLEVSITKHKSRLVAVIGHYDCAGNPVDKKTQLIQINNSIKTIKSWGYIIDIIGLWIDENWMVHEIKREEEKSLKTI
jgi:carbonic anhydrase